MSDEVRLVDRFIPVMDQGRYWDWQRGYAKERAPGGKKHPVTDKPEVEWVRVGDIEGKVWLQRFPVSDCVSAREHITTVNFYVKNTSIWCSDDPEVFALLAKLGIKPTPAEEAKP